MRSASPWPASPPASTTTSSGPSTTGPTASSSPWSTRQEAQDAVAACLYPPLGNRSVGGSVHALNSDTDAADYYANANHEILVVLQCEHIQAVRDFDQVFSVPGIDAVFVG